MCETEKEHHLETRGAQDPRGTSDVHTRASAITISTPFAWVSRRDSLKEIRDSHKRRFYQKHLHVGKIFD